MNNNVCIYRNFNFDGNIYAKMSKKIDFIEVEMTLYKDGYPCSIKKTKNNVEIFRNNLPGVYKINAEVLSKTMNVLTVESKEIIIKDVLIKDNIKNNTIKKKQ